MHQIEQALSAVGSTPDEVADTFRRAGVKGVRGTDSFLNPVVRYLNRTLDIGSRLEIEPGSNRLRLVHGGQVQETVLPAPVGEFLDRFHQGAYRDLEEA